MRHDNLWKERPALPNFWAHRICADITLKRLEGSPAADMIKRNEASYRLGSQGADMMYFRPMQLLRGKRGVVYHAKLLHAQPIEKLANMSRRYLAGPAGKRQFASTFAYICGFLCHHAVDQKVHPLIDARAVSVLRHRRIELDFDAFISSELHIKHDKGNSHWTGMGEFAGFSGLAQWYNYMFHSLYSKKFSLRSYMRDYRALRRASVFLDRPRRLKKLKHTDRPVLSGQELRWMMSAALQGCRNAADMIDRMYAELDAQMLSQASRTTVGAAQALVT
jgi:hypothetical protein